MADVKWIKLATGLPNNRKIKQIRKLPDGDAIALMWVFLMCLAGQVNESGAVYFTSEIPYTDEMLAEEFDMDVNTIRLGITTFQRFGMIDVVDEIIHLSSWEKWQAVDRLSEIREYNRLAKQKSRAKQKQKLLENVNDKSMTNQRCHDTEEDIEEDKDKEGDIKDNIPDSDEPEPPAPKKTKPVKHKYGEYKNVLLSDDELEKLKAEYPDISERIERLSSYVASTGKSYKSHYATIRNWARKDAEKPGRKEMVPYWMKKNQFNTFPERDAENMDDLERALLGAPKTAANDENLRRRAEELKKRLRGADNESD